MNSRFWEQSRIRARQKKGRTGAWGKELTLTVFSPLSQFIGTAALIVCVLAIVDPYNNPVPRGLEAFTVGLVVLVIGTSMGFNSGYAVNPARDFGPRLFTALAGWGSEVFT